MNWKQLLKPTRFRDGEPLKSFDGRNQFENDYSRLISSSFIRRLQDKTQVFPLQQSDFIRTRLTHSLEVSSIAKSIGKSVELELIRKGKMDKNLKELLPSLLMTTGLIHDLGNPPYGHFGETAIQDFFRNYLFDKKKLNDQEKNDLIYFDGNVQTFRILTKLQYMGDNLSYNLSFPTLATIIKYPKNSLTGNKGKSTSDIHEKKFGYFITEAEQYSKISRNLGLNGKRHPATFLLEAADDIAYSAADIEDGIKLGILDYDIIYSTFANKLKGTRYRKTVLDQLSKYRKQFAGLPADKLSLIVTRFRIFTQGLMIGEIIKHFVLMHDDILNGSYSKELLQDSDVVHLREAFKELSYLVFDNNRVIQAELAGYEIIQGLLKCFVGASDSPQFKSSGKDLEGRFFKMISSSLRFIYSNYTTHENPEYLRYQLIVDFISGMTDSYAINYYKKIKGISY